MLPSQRGAALLLCVAMPDRSTAQLLGLAAAGLLAVIACDRGARPHPPERDGCAEGHVDEARTRRVLALLSTARAGRSLLERARRPLRVCHGHGIAPTITTEGALALDSAEQDAESAARLGHLLQHAVHGAPLSKSFDPARSCSALVREAIDAEASAHALELELRRALGVMHPRRVLPFEPAYWAAPAGQRLDVLRSYFWRHPGGGAGLPGFVDAYSRRCAEIQRRPPGAVPSAAPAR
jgi:hypothetical protein